MKSRKKRPSAPGPVKIGYTTLPSGQRISGIDAIREAYETYRKELRLTQKQYRERQRLLGEMYFLLETAVSGDQIRRLWFEICLWAAPFAARAWARFHGEITRSFNPKEQETTEQENVGAALAGLVLLADFWAAEQVLPSRAGEPTADEVCGMCRARIERRYLQPLDRKLTGRSVRIRFTTRYKARRRKRIVREAYELGREAGLRRQEFVAVASKALEVDGVTIYRYLAKVRRRAKAATGVIGRSG